MSTLIGGGINDLDDEDNNNKSYLYPATVFVNSRNPFQDGCVDIYLWCVAPSEKPPVEENSDK